MALSGRRILVVHDEPLAALLLERMLRQLGCSVPGRAGTAADAVAIIETDRLGLDAATISLAEDGGTEVAIALEQRGIPFITTAGADSASLASRFGKRPLLARPFLLEELQHALNNLDMRPRHSTR